MKFVLKLKEEEKLSLLKFFNGEIMELEPKIGTNIEFVKWRNVEFLEK